MSKIALQRNSDTDITIIQNRFIDFYMPSANGEYVKLYLYVLRMDMARRNFSIEQAADALEHTENDIGRALSYWEKQKLWQLQRNQKGEICSIKILDITTESDNHVPAIETAATMQTPQKELLTADRIASLKKQDEMKQLLFIASQYLGKTLSPTEISNILYFYDTLHFSTELIEYLIEYCVSKGSKSCRYIEKVAIEWAKEGITTVEAAKRGTSLYHKKYYTVLNSFGIKGRGPAKSEIECIDRWTNEFHFTMDIILEACNRTIAQTHQPNFQYANKILTEWSKSGIKHLKDIKNADMAFHKKKKAVDSKPQPATGNRFHNFHQRDYDFTELEKQLLKR